MILKTLLGLFILYALFCGLYFFMQKRMIFFPNLTDFHTCDSLARGEGTAIQEGKSRYYLFETSSSDPRGYVIHFHGNGGRACDRYPYLQEFKNLGFHLILAEYPGYAQDAPLPGQDELLKNALETVEVVRKKYPNLPMILFGESLGSAVATWVATKTQVQALILQTPFESLGNVGKHHYPWLPIKTLLRLPFPAHQWAAKTKAPVFVFHGKNDEIIPFEMGRRQFENFKGSNNVFWEVPNAGHNNILLRGETELWRRIGAFL